MYLKFIFHDQRHTTLMSEDGHVSSRSHFSFIFLIRWVLTATSGTKPIIVSAGHVYILLHQREKWGSTIQYGYKKLGTHERVFSQTLAHGNSKAEIRQWDRRKSIRRDTWVWKKVKRARKKEVPTAYHNLIKIE